MRGDGTYGEGARGCSTPAHLTQMLMSINVRTVHYTSMNAYWGRGGLEKQEPKRGPVGVRPVALVGNILRRGGRRAVDLDKLHKGVSSLVAPSSDDVVSSLTSLIISLSTDIAVSCGLRQSTVL